MDILTAINTRVSALKLSEPGPTREHLNEMLRAGAHAPDHGRLGPWRFVIVEGEGRSILGDALVAATIARSPDASQSTLDTERQKAFRAPSIIIVAARLVDKGQSIPAIEQILAAGAAAQNIMLAAHALNYGAMWKTGQAVYDSSFKILIGLEPEDHVVAMIYLGTTTTPGQPRDCDFESKTRWLSS
jgi:nitroreductase